jgi:hypothetical protein
MDGDFIFQRIQQQGREANESFERRLKASAPLEVLLECEDSDAELAKMMGDMERQFAPAENPWDVEKFTPVRELAPLSLAELEKKFSAPENPWGKAAEPQPGTEHQDEEDEREEIEIPPDRATRYERHVETMKGRILSRMQGGASRASAVAELLKIAGGNSYSRQIVRDAEMQSPDA